MAVKNSAKNSMGTWKCKNCKQINNIDQSLRDRAKEGAGDYLWKIIVYGDPFTTECCQCGSVTILSTSVRVKQVNC